MEDKNKRRLSILHPLTNKNTLLSTTAAAATNTNTTTTATTATTANNSNNNNNNTFAAVIASTTSSVNNSPANLQHARNLNFPPNYNFNGINPITSNTTTTTTTTTPTPTPTPTLPGNHISNNRIQLGFGIPPDSYIYGRGYNGKPMGLDNDQIPRYIPNEHSKRGILTTSNRNIYQESNHHVHHQQQQHQQQQQQQQHLNLSYNNVSTNQSQFGFILPQQLKNESTNNLQVSNLEIYNNLNPRKSPNMNYKEKISNWMASIPQFNNSENNEIYIDCYPGVISTSNTPSTSDEEIDLSDVEDILELQAQKVTKYVTRLYIHEVENSCLTRDGNAHNDNDDDDDDDDDDDVDDDDDDDDEEEEEEEDDEGENNDREKAIDDLPGARNEQAIQRNVEISYQKNGMNRLIHRDPNTPISFNIN